MITAQIDRETLTITVSGHANAKKNAQGHDLVCCAASTLAQAYYYAGIRKGYMMELHTDHGYLMARPDPRRKAGEDLENIFVGYALGFELLADNYPENVRMAVN